MISHTIPGDKVRVYRRPNSSSWQCATYLDGREWRVSTKTDSLSQAKDFAEDWYDAVHLKNTLDAKAINLRRKTRASHAPLDE